MGQVMKESKGTVNPKLANDLLISELNNKKKQYFVKKILAEKELPYSLIDTSSEIDAYNEYLNNFVDQTKIEE